MNLASPRLLWSLSVPLIPYHSLKRMHREICWVELELLYLLPYHRLRPLNKLKKKFNKMAEKRIVHPELPLSAFLIRLRTSCTSVTLLLVLRKDRLWCCRDVVEVLNSISSSLCNRDEEEQRTSMSQSSKSAEPERRLLVAPVCESIVLDFEILCKDYWLTLLYA